jgi:diketogulonate reductase-like aldo/keto reductase
MSVTTVTTNAGVQMPRLIYGTAWKKEATTQLVIKAILNGFRGIDTACQPKHYSEDLVGQALVELQTKHNINRQDLFIQTKFISIRGQDQSKPLPYDPHAPLAEQVRQSLSTSLKNLHTDYIDSLVLHSPLQSHDLTMEVYREFEKFVDQGRVKQLGISNLYNLNGLRKLYDDARHKPSVLQNRFHAETNYDHDLRQFCREKNIFYQSFWTLTANPHILEHSIIQQLAQERHGTPAQVFFRFLIDIGLTPLTGTTNEKHMKEDLQVLHWHSLDDESVGKLKKLIHD